MGLSVFPPIASKQIPHLGPLGDGGDAGGAGGGGRRRPTACAVVVATLVLIALFCGEYRGLFVGLGTDGRLLEMISISGDPVRSINSLSGLFLAGREGVGMGLDREPLAKALVPRSSSKSS
ncbi:hypothetical protein NADE_007146 [Nannochloris sp. 'desiccata']|nr:hypothetical protein NADE_007146 [Chlorella desiccata (nom. nud.)]